MACHACSRKTLSVFIRSLANTEPLPLSRSTPNRRDPPFSRPFSHSSHLQAAKHSRAGPPKPFNTNKPQDDNNSAKPAREKEPWQIQKAALKEKLGGQAWNPRKKLSPDTIEGIRHLHQTQPERFTTSVLSQHFKVSAEAIRRILKSKWRPSDEEQEERLRRWDRRGEKIWSNLVELGIKPPKRWREMGVGRAKQGQRPRWKQGGRNMVPVNDSVGGGGLEEEIIPVVDGEGKRRERREEVIPLAERI